MAEPADSADPAGRRSFGRTVLLGLGSAALAAVTGSRDWVTVDAAPGDGAFATVVGATGDLTAPPVTATALVLLAAWGVLLVSRGRARYAVAWLALVAAVAVLGFAVAAWVARPGDVTEASRTLDLDVGRSLWAHVGVVAAVAALASAATAVRRVRAWPEMGRRYDAPAGPEATPTDASVEERSSLDLWKALDEGRDPTDARDD